MLCCAQSLSHVQLFATQWVVARRLSVHGILQVSSWSGLPFPPPGDLPNPGTDPESPVSPTLAEGFFFFTTESPGKTSSSLTSVQTHTPCIGGEVPTTGPPQKFPQGLFRT